MSQLKVKFLWGSCFLMSLSVWASEGVLDTTFHSPDGYVLWDGGSGYDRGRGIAIQQDGKILVTGYMTNGKDNDLMVIRYEKDGTLDVGFGTNGAYIYDGGYGNDGGYAIAVQSDNEILVAGDTSNGSDSDVIVLRLDTDGNLDPNFGSDGIYTYDSGNGSDSAVDLLVQSDGRIVVCGSSSNGMDNNILVVRLNANGTPDITFGTNGLTVYDVGNSHDFGSRLTVQNDGKILVTGSSYNGSDHDIIVARFNVNGTLDTTFGTGGIVLYDGGDYDRGYGIDTSSNGDILVTGLQTKPDPNITDYDIPVICFDSNGVLDTSFGNNGIVLFDGGNREECYSLVVQNDDTILVAGHSGNSTAGPSDWNLVVLKYNPNGTLDTTFGSNGVYQYNPTGNTEWGYGLALQTDGKIVVTGQAHNGMDDDVIVLRLTNSADDNNESSDSNDITASLMWSQPPVESDPKVEQEPVFCGWNEPARSTESSGLNRQWRMDADDFHCIGATPVTRIRWWGGYKAWTSSVPPIPQPMSWHIGFWANQFEGINQDESFPERLVWSLEIPSERIYLEPLGLNEFPEQQPSMCYVYEVNLEPNEWFCQAEFESNYDKFWISITAIYPIDAEQVNMWGWFTRPHVWGNGAVMPAIMGDWPTYDERLFPGRIYPIENSLLCGQNQAYNMCFELLTEQSWIKWDQPFTNLRDWQYCEDQESFAIEDESGNLQVEHRVADDWLCERTSPVVAVGWYGSYIGYGYEPCKCDQVAEPRRPDYFVLSLRTPTNDPAGDGNLSGLVWEYLAYDYDEVLVGYDRNPQAEPNEPVFRYSVRLPQDAWFQQEHLDRVYWFSVVAVYRAQLDEIECPWGWTNCLYTFGSAAINVSVTDDGLVREPIHTQTGELVDMSFTLFAAPEQ
jgi:uncharacterized delta-60 repeat protein